MCLEFPIPLSPMCFIVTLTVSYAFENDIVICKKSCSLIFVSALFKREKIKKEAEKISFKCAMYVKGLLIRKEMR